MMLRGSTIALVATLMMTLAGCDNSTAADAVIEQTIQDMEDLVEVLATIDDEASAEAAVPRLEALGERMARTKEQQEALEGSLSESEMAELEAKHKDELMAVGMKLAGEMMRIGPQPELMQHIESVEGVLP